MASEVDGNSAPAANTTKAGTWPRITVGKPIHVGGSQPWVCLGKVRMRLPWLGEPEEQPPDEEATQTIYIYTGFGLTADEARDNVIKQLEAVAGQKSRIDVLKRVSEAPPPSLPVSAPVPWYRRLFRKS